jgi:hypothetical protein
MRLSDVPAEPTLCCSRFIALSRDPLPPTQSSAGHVNGYKTSIVFSLAEGACDE